MSTTYLVDTSAWIEFLRKTGSETNTFVHQLISQGAKLATTEPVTAELLCGAKSDAELQQLERLTSGLVLLSVDNRIDYHELARLFRTARSHGKTVRKPFDCLIAAVAIRSNATLVHYDRDFDQLAEVFPRLRVQRHNAT